MLHGQLQFKKFNVIILIIKLILDSMATSATLKASK